MLIRPLIDVPPMGIDETPLMSQPLFSVRRAMKTAGAGLPVHAHGDAQLTYAAAGMVQVHTDGGVWLVPPQLAGWVPAGVRHRLEIITDAELWIVHWQGRAVEAWAPRMALDRAFALRVTPLLRSLLATAVSARTGASKAELVVRLMLHELTAMPEAPTFLPLPTSPAARRAADLALVDHRNGLGLDDLAARAATSARTISRLFPQETGLSFKTWRQRARIVRSMNRLASGVSIAKVSEETGYASTAAFSSAFRSVTAMTPSTFLERTLPRRP